MPFCSYDYLLIISLIIPLIIALFSGREEQAAACRSVAQPLRNSGKHVRHRNLALVQQQPFGGDERDDDHDGGVTAWAAAL